MTTLLMTKRGSVTIPPDVRRRLGVDGIRNPLLIVEERDGGLFLQPASAIPVRTVPRAIIDKWIRSDEEDMQSLRAAGKA